MKNFIFTLFLLCILSAGAFGQTNTINGMISASDLSIYNSYFLEKDNKRKVNYWTLGGLCDDHWDKIASLSGDTADIDINDELLYASYICSESIKARPVQAAQMLPKNRDSDLKVGAFMYQNLQIATFLKGSNASVYATLLNEFCAENRINKAEIETYYRNGIRALVSAVVDEEFNKVSFMLDNTTIRRSYNTVLKRNPQTGQCILIYEGYFNGNKQTKTLTASSLDALPSAMLGNTEDFDQACANTVRVQAPLIPAVALSDAALDEIKTILTNFYTTPNTTTYSAAKEVYELYTNLRLKTVEAIYELIRRAYVATLFNNSLANKVINEAQISGTLTSLTREQQQRLVQLR